MSGLIGKITREGMMAQRLSGDGIIFVGLIKPHAMEVLIDDLLEVKILAHTDCGGIFEVKHDFRFFIGGSKIELIIEIHKDNMTYINAEFREVDIELHR